MRKLQAANFFFNFSHTYQAERLGPAIKRPATACPLHTHILDLLRLLKGMHRKLHVVWQFTLLFLGISVDCLSSGQTWKAETSLVRFWQDKDGCSSDLLDEATIDEMEDRMSCWCLPLIIASSANLSGSSRSAFPSRCAILCLTSCKYAHTEIK